MDIAGIKASTDAILAQLPGLEGFVDGVQQKLTESVQQVVGEAMAGVADGISQIVGLGQSIDGATVTIEASGPLVIEFPKFTAKVSMPLKVQKGNE
jgi:hypothetical protein